MSDESLPVLPADVVLTLVESVGRRADAEFYLSSFRELPRHAFAIVAPEAAALAEAELRVVDHLRFLAHLGLVAPVVLGLTDPEAAQPLVEPLCRNLEAAGVEIRRYADATEQLPQVLRRELDRGRVPVVTFRPGTSAREERHRQVGAWAGELGTRKLVLVRARGGIGPISGASLPLGPGHELPITARGISLINLRRDHDVLVRAGVLSEDEVALLGGVRSAMRAAVQAAQAARGPGSPSDRLVTSVTAPVNLLHELFTVKGAGTLIKHGSRIDKYADYAGLDQARLWDLLERTFSRSLRPDFPLKSPHGVYVEQGYRGAAIVMRRQGIAFLSKFVVDRLAQGLGIGRDLWQAVVSDHPSLFWRARPDNPIAHWYDRQCQGMLRTPHWNVYFRGVQHTDVPRLTEDAITLASDFAE